MKTLLFRVHKQTDDKFIKEVITFTKGYFDLSNQKVKLSFEEFILSDFIPGIEINTGKIYDLFIHTSDKNKMNIAHACSWTYVKCNK